MSVTKETLGLGEWTWISLLVNSAAFALNVTLFRIGGDPFVAACAGFSFAVTIMSIAIDRIFLAPERKAIRIMQEYLEKRMKNDPTKST